MTEKEIIIAGHKVRYGEQGTGNAGVVYVFLHGWGSDYTVFHSLFEAVDCAIALDFPGFGGSSPLREPLTLAAYSAVLRAFIEKKADGREVVFVAHSFGGRVLLHLLSQQSKLPWVRKIICIGVPFVREQGLGQFVLQAMLKAAKVAARLLPESLRREVRERWHAVVGAEDYAALENEVMRKTFQYIIAADMQHLAQSLHEYDTVFIWGADDFAAPVADAEMIAREVDAHMHTIEGGDHFPFLGDTEGAFRAVFKQHL